MSDEEIIMNSDEFDTDDGIEMPHFVLPQTLDEDDEEIEYYAKKLGINDEIDEWDDDMRSLGYAKLLENITSGRRTRHEKPVEMVKAARTEEEEAARKDFTGLLNRIAPSNYGAIAARLRVAFASHPPEVSVAMFTRCLTQRIFADAPLPALFIDCYSKALKEVPDAIQPVLDKIKERESVNTKPFLEALGDDIVSFYSSAKGVKADEEVAQLAKVARQMHMNTDVRKNVFYALTTAADVSNAYEKVSKLKLSKTQRKDVPMVIIECCRKESAYNPFYASLTTCFLENEKKFDKDLRVALRNTIKLMPGLDVKQIRNVAMFCDELIQKGALDGIGFLKGIRLMELDAQALIFVKILLRELFTKWERESILAEMKRIGSMPNFAADFQRFLEKRLKPFMEGPNIPSDRRALVSKAIAVIGEAMLHNS